MFVGQGPSGLPEDRVVNVFHFTSFLNYETFAPTVENAVAAFYNLGSSPVPLGAYLSVWVSRNAQVLTYNLADAKPREPRVLPVTLPSSLAGGGLPEEVACCLSLLGAPPVTRRRRGRVFIGPLSSAATETASGTLPTRPSVEFQNVLRAAWIQLKADTDGGAAFGWSIRSVTPAENFVKIESGYVDDALDTIRKRGPRTTSRLVFPTV
jgi:hypothetical protein